jgi:CHAD domain-containing protein
MTTRFPSGDPRYPHQLPSARGVISAVNFAQNDDAEWLLKRIPSVRKPAGQMRDMDVLTSLGATLARKGSQDERLIQLLEYLGAKRLRASQKLSKVIGNNHNDLRRHMKQYSGFVKENSRANTSGTFALRKNATAQVLEVAETANS